MKNLFRITVLSFITIAMVSMYSCKKSDTPINEQTPSQICKSTNSNFDAYLNEIGVFHNQVLDYIAENGDVAAMSREQRFYLAKEYTHSEHEWKTMELLGNDLWEYIETSTPIVNYFEGPQFTQAGLDYINRIDRVLETAINEIQQENHFKPDAYNTEIDAIINAIFENEEVIIDMEIDKCNEFGAIVAMCYLSKATYGYWYNSALNEGSLWHPYLALSTETKLPDWAHKAIKAIKVAAVDTWAWVGNYETFEFIGDDGKTYTGYRWVVPECNAVASEASGSVK